MLFILLNAAALIWIRHELNDEAKSHKFQITGYSPARNLDLADRFSLTFDQALVPADAVGKRLDRVPFWIEPEPDGHWEWASPTQLEYRLHRPLPPGRKYKIIAADDIEVQTGMRFSGPREMYFETRKLELNSYRLMAADRENVTVELKFNQRVDPASLARYLQVQDGYSYSRINSAIMTREISETFVVRAARPRSNELGIWLDGSLTGFGGQLPIGSGVTRWISISPNFAMTSAQVGQQSSFTHNAVVYIYFNNQLDRNQPSPDIQLSPKVEGVISRVSNGQIVLEGPFEWGVTYTVTVGADVKSVQGDTLGHPETTHFFIPMPPPRVEFSAPGGILSPGGNLLVDLNTVNVRSLNLSATRVYSNNIVAHLQHRGRWCRNYDYEGDLGYQYDDFYDNGSNDRDTSRQILSKEVHLSARANVPKTVALELRDLLKNPLGVYRIRAAANDERWTGDTTLVTVTDLALTAKREKGGMTVWVTRLKSAKPVSGAKVSAVTYTNQTLAAALTGEDGIAHLSFTEDHPDGPPWVVLAELGDDLAYLRPEQRPWLIDDIDQSGREIPKNYDAMLYTERGVYRPGETIHLSGIIREAEGGVPPTFPLRISITRPDGRFVAQLSAKPEENAEGFFHADYTTRPDDQTGVYQFAATLPGATDVLGTAEAKVEAFVPTRIEVKTESPQSLYSGGDKPVLSVSARYLFGSLCAGLPLSVSESYEFDPFESRRFTGFTFGDPDGNKTFRLDPMTLNLDAEGKAKVDLLGVQNQKAGLWRGTISATVTDPGGRSVSANAALTIDTANRYLGIRIPGGKAMPVDTPFRVEWIQLTGKDEPAEPGAVELALTRYETEWVVEEVNHHPTWKAVKNAIPISTRTIEADAATTASINSASITCPIAGQYELKILDRKSSGTASLTFYASNWNSELNTIAFNRPDRLDVVLDQESYAPGATAKAIVRSPFGGTLLLTIETDHVIDRRVVDLTENTGQIEFPVPSNLRGGAFVAASVVRAIDPASKDWLPHRAMGLTRLKIDPLEYHMAIALNAPEKVEPGESLTVDVKTDPPADPAHPGMVHVWAVDEGILLNTAYATPDPIKHFLAARKLAVKSSDVFSDLMPDNERPETVDRIGADGDGDWQYRNPIQSKARESAVIWRGIAALDADGHTSLRMTMPKMTGEMRLMAVAAAGDRYGSAHRAVTLSSPLMIELGCPRFAAPGDLFALPVKVFNGTDRATTVTLNLTAEGPLTFDPSAATMSLFLNPNQPDQFWLKCEAGQSGEARIKITGASSNGGETMAVASAEGNFPIRPIAPIEVDTQLISVKAGEEIEIKPPLGFLPDSMRSRVSVSGSPAVQLRPALERLVEYPYGCIEQTTSKLLGMLYAPEIIGADFPDDIRERSIRSMVNAGIARIWSMQTPSGGLSYWPGNTDPYPWGTVYASDCLLEASRAGYEVDKRLTDTLADYLENALKDNPAQGGGDVFNDDNTRAQVCYVLAGFNRPQKGWMSRLSEQLDRLDTAGRAHLAAAWLAVGQRDRALAVLPEDTINKSAARTRSGRLTSSIQQDAVLLNLALDLDPNHPWIPTLVRRIEGAREKGCWYSTLENSAALTSLARYQLVTREKSDFSGTVSTPEGEKFTFDHTAPKAFKLSDALQPIKIASTGTGRVFISFSTKGLRTRAAFKEEDQQLKVRRRWLDEKGAPIDPKKVKVGDLIFVEVTLGAPDRANYSVVDNVAVVDALPGGVEVENPKLATSAQTAGREGDRPDRVEFLDDRVLLFSSAGYQDKTFRYALRATTAGTFGVPPIQAECMYDPSFASINGGGRMEIGL